MTKGVNLRKNQLKALGLRNLKNTMKIEKGNSSLNLLLWSDVTVMTALSLSAVDCFWW